MHEISTTLNDALDQSKELHLLMEGHFDRMRALLSSHLSVISSQTLDHILQGANTAQQSNAIEITTSYRKQEIGAGISICSSDADLAIQRMTKRFFDALVGPEETSTQVLNLVLSQLGNWNPDANANQLSDMLSAAIREVQNRFTTVTLPKLRDELEIVFQLTIDIPSKAQTCVADLLR